MTTRSTLLASGSTLAPNEVATVYTCPAGFTTIIKDIRASKNAAGQHDLYIGVRSGARDHWIIYGGVPSGTNITFVNCWVVMQPGHSIQVFGTVDHGWHWWISGTRLVGVAP